MDNHKKETETKKRTFPCWLTHARWTLTMNPSYQTARWKDSFQRNCARDKNQKCHIWLSLLFLGIPLSSVHFPLKHWHHCRNYTWTRVTPRPRGSPSECSGSAVLLTSCLSALEVMSGPQRDIIVTERGARDWQWFNLGVLQTILWDEKKTPQQGCVVQNLTHTTKFHNDDMLLGKDPKCLTNEQTIPFENMNLWGLCSGT